MKFYVHIAGLAVLYLVASLVLRETFDVQGFTSILSAYPHSSAALAVFLFMFLSVLPVPSAPFIVASGFFFGPLEGALYASIGETIGACILFVAVRSIGTDRLSARATQSARLFRQYATRLQTHGTTTVLALRLMPVIPFFVLNIALGFSRVRFIHFLSGTALGLIVMTLLFSYAGSSMLTAPLAGALSLILLIILYMGFSKNHLLIQQTIHDDEY